MDHSGNQVREENSVRVFYLIISIGRTKLKMKWKNWPTPMITLTHAQNDDLTNCVRKGSYYNG